jgi:hypothetical protein
VDEQQQPAGGVGQGRGQRRRVGGQLGPVAAKGHGQGQRAAAFGQVVAHDAVERGQGSATLRRGLGRLALARAEQPFERDQGRVHARADEARGAADGAIGQGGDATAARRRGDANMDALDHVGDAHCGVGQQPGQGAEVGGVEVGVVVRVGHGAMV